MKTIEQLNKTIEQWTRLRVLMVLLCCCMVSSAGALLWASLGPEGVGQRWTVGVNVVALVMAVTLLTKVVRHPLRLRWQREDH